MTPADPAGAGERTPRGERRRRALLAAALRIIVRDGPGAVTLRSVVTEARASHGSVAYYFGSRQALIRQALADIADRNVAALAEAWPEIERHADDPAAVARLIARHSTRQMVEDRAMGITIFELHLAAARDPELRPLLRRWGRSYARITRDTLAMLGSTSPESDAALLTNTISGLVIGQLSLPRDDFQEGILRPALERLLVGIRADAAGTGASSG